MFNTTLMKTWSRIW